MPGRRCAASINRARFSWRHPDLVAVAAAMAEDDTASVAGWLQQGQLQKADEALDTALTTAAEEVWAVVVAPWVLVQAQRSPS